MWGVGAASFLVLLRIFSDQLLSFPSMLLAEEILSNAPILLNSISPPLSETMVYLPLKGWTFYLITSVRVKVFVFLKDAPFFSELSFFNTDINETSTCSYVTESHIQARMDAEAPICLEVSIRIQWNRRVKGWETLQQYYERDWFPILS